MPKLINLVLPVCSLTAMTIVPIFTKSPPSSSQKGHRRMWIYMCVMCKRYTSGSPSDMWQQEKHGRYVPWCSSPASAHATKFQVEPEKKRLIEGILHTCLISPYPLSSWIQDGFWEVKITIKHNECWWVMMLTTFVKNVLRSVDNDQNKESTERFLNGVVNLFDRNQGGNKVWNRYCHRQQITHRLVILCLLPIFSHLFSLFNALHTLFVLYPTASISSNKVQSPKKRDPTITTITIYLRHTTII